MIEGSGSGSGLTALGPQHCFFFWGGGGPWIQIRIRNQWSGSETLLECVILLKFPVPLKLDPFPGVLRVLICSQRLGIISFIKWVLLMIALYVQASSVSCSCLHPDQWCIICLGRREHTHQMDIHQQSRFLLHLFLIGSNLNIADVTGSDVNSARI